MNGSARRKTDPIDLLAIADLRIAGRGYEVAVGDEPLVELAGWVGHRSRRVHARTGLKNQLLGQVDRCFPGPAGCLSDVLRTKVGRLVLTEFADPDGWPGSAWPASAASPPAVTCASAAR